MEWLFDFLCLSPSGLALVYSVNVFIMIFFMFSFCLFALLSGAPLLLKSFEPL